ncbi:MAG: hypothetical protein COT81_01680 [Candidatus Buchananbacteria bacterium CG10_big_fil_rev_8_21_14_0_10_42_9]|uniref:riboflavin kinase n=1 Tax=Candidatus Buchananbacteria bacterium CG10_big_fil_rev_8_21_14_0_10_42_9 TaxID=1974526 RepID=A0A2H0W1X2_9BACT|nr:MAG: hypothetical protein COT81_01680 [Candidatus Buchananbacteria bacterium CG10_big_fil_rev_8_21_14_0_10_42_9]
MPITIDGVVIKGRQQGERLGFKTANLKIKPGQYKPGVFVSETTIRQDKYPGVSHVGPAPTFNQNEWLCETYLFDYQKILYGQKISVKILKKIRDSKKFDNPDELKQAIERDVQIARDFFKQ